jgi:hypothetical protein
MVVQSMLSMHATSSQASLDTGRKCLVQTMMVVGGDISVFFETSQSYILYVDNYLCEV